MRTSPTTWRAARSRAQRDTVVYRTRKFVGRHRWPVSVAVAFFCPDGGLRFRGRRGNPRKVTERTRPGPTRTGQGRRTWSKCSRTCSKGRTPPCPPMGETLEPRGFHRSHCGTGRGHGCPAHGPGPPFGAAGGSPLCPQPVSAGAGEAYESALAFTPGAGGRSAGGTEH